LNWIKLLFSNDLIEFYSKKFNITDHIKKELDFVIMMYLNTAENIKLTVDSIPLNEDDLPLGFPRLLAVDQPLILPANVFVRLLVTSSDVIHS